MIFYAMLPNMEHPTFEAREMGTDAAKSILDNLDKGPVWGYLTEWDMARLQGMVDACALMNGSIVIRSDPHRIGMLMIHYENHSLYGVFETKVHDPNFKFVMRQPMRPLIHPLYSATEEALKFMSGVQGSEPRIKFETTASAEMVFQVKADTPDLTIVDKFPEIVTAIHRLSTAKEIVLSDRNPAATYQEYLESLKTYFLNRAEDGNRSPMVIYANTNWGVWVDVDAEKVMRLYGHYKSGFKDDGDFKGLVMNIPAVKMFFESTGRECASYH